MKAAAPLSKMPAEIWRFCAGQLPSQRSAVRRRPPAAGRARAYSRVGRGAWQPGPIPGVAAHLKILIVTDAWRPQVNGVVRTLEVLGEDLTALGHHVRYATPEGRFTVPMPTYPEIRLALFPRARLEKEIRDFAPDAVHIATEGTLGLCGARHLHQIRHRLFHLVPHPLSRICQSALSLCAAKNWSIAGCAGFTGPPPR